MGRVYDALRRAETQPQTSPSETSTNTDSVGGNLAHFVPRPEHPWDASPFTASPVGFSSAPSAHTDEASAGQALLGEPAYRDVGATLGAVGTARAAEFSSRVISAARVEPHLFAITQPRSPECEHFRSLRTKLLEAGERQNMHAFVVTSSGVGEGKTLMSANLAWLLAQTDGVKALLIDADLRSPAAAAYFGIENEFGLSEVLTGNKKLTQAIVKLQPAGLHLLPGGAPREDVAELLSGPRFSRLLAEARKHFDYIIIDAPPLGIFTDANLLINRADGALLVVRSGKTRYAVVDRLLENLPRGRMLGVVVNRAETRPDETAYYYAQRQYHPIADPDEAVEPAEDDQDLEMIYIEEDVVS
jgi:capsular exopolysaccharide synthesis family protein